VGAIVGGVVGGVAGIALIGGLIAWLLIRRSSQKHHQAPPVAPNGQAYTPAPTYPPNGGYPQMAQQQPPYGQHPGATPSTFPPTSPYATAAPTLAASTPSAYDPHQSYYDPSKLAPGEVSPNHPVGFQPSPSPPQPYAGTPPAAGVHYNPHHSTMSELDPGSVPAGHYANPVEMSAEPYRG
jgi:hypothetical protein